MTTFEFGVYSLGERLLLDEGQRLSSRERIENIIQMGKWADQAGLDVFGIGEHHRGDFVTSSYAMILGAIARETKAIKLTSTLSVISTVDPVRLYEDMATLDLLSNGRAEVILGRGAFLDSFKLFGADVRQYDQLFEEKLELFNQLQEQEKVTWQGQFRPALKNASIAPRPVQEKLPTWIGVGGSPESVERAARLGYKMALGVLGGTVDQFKPLTDLYWAVAKEHGHDLNQMQIAITGHSFVGETGYQTRKDFLLPYNRYQQYFAKERGFHFAQTKLSDLERQSSPEYMLAVGSSDELVDKILYQHEQLGQTRFMGQFDMGGMPLAKVEKAIDLLANDVAPKVRKALAH